MKKISDLKKSQNVLEKEAKQQKDIYTIHLKSAYDWYNSTRAKENKTPLDLSFIIEIEEAHKMEIIKQYHKSLQIGL